MPAIACCVGVSEAFGLDIIMHWEKSVTTERYHEFLRVLRAKYPERKMCLVMDNLSFHISNATTKVYEDLGYRWIRNPPHSPIANPIEFVFSVAKQRYKKARLSQIINGTNVPVVDMVLDSFKCIDEELIKGCVR